MPVSESTLPAQACGEPAQSKCEGTRCQLTEHNQLMLEIYDIAYQKK